jgi:hypothetical protein
VIKIFNLNISMIIILVTCSKVMYLHVPKTLKLLKQVCKPLSNFVIDSFKEGLSIKTMTKSAKICFNIFKVSDES